MHLADLAATSRRVAATTRRLEKVAIIAELLRRVDGDEIELAVSYICGNVPQPKLGVGYAAVRAALPEGAVESPTLSLREVDEALARIARTGGPGSAEERVRLLRDLLSRATGEEQRFLLRLLAGELRQGALEAVVLESVAQAASVPVELVRRSLMTVGDLPTVAKAALTGGVSALSQHGIQLFRPVLPMLAESATDPGDAMTQLGEAALEYKLDGARVQIHKSGDEVRVYSRALNDVTAAVPELVEVTRALPAREIILDGETIALRPDGAPHPFQITMRRYGRKLDVDRLRSEIPLSSFFFDLLWLDGAPLLDESQVRRIEAMRSVLPAALMVPSMVTGSAEEAEAFLRAALGQGHEGIMAKALDAPYEAGHRGSRWLKVKQAHTLDLVVLAAEWGHGRRQGRLSNLHLGARDPATGGFVMLGKTFKGLTDKMLEWQTRRFLELEIGRDAYTVYLKPDVVVEVAFNDVQASSQYPGGVALRFARVKRYREDKTGAEADTIEAVRGLTR
jgi:DNA ligase-1